MITLTFEEFLERTGIPAEELLAELRSMEADGILICTMDEIKNEPVWFAAQELEDLPQRS